MSEKTWLEMTPETKKSVGLNAQRTMGTGVYHLPLTNGWSVSAVPQWLGEGQKKSYMPVVNPPNESPIMLTDNVCDTLAETFKTGIRYRYHMIVEDLHELVDGFF